MRHLPMLCLWAALALPGAPARAQAMAAPADLTALDAQGLEQLRALTRELQARGLAFQPVSALTWSQLDARSRDELLALYQKARDGKLGQPAGTLDARTDAADAQALKALADKKIVDKGLIGRLTQLAGNKKRALADWYRSLLPRLDLGNLADPAQLTRACQLLGRAAPDVCGQLVPPPSPVIAPGRPLALMPGGTAAQDVAGQTPPLGRSDRPFNPLGFMEVVKIDFMDTGARCSGTLIAAGVVLTAAHCVDGRAPGDVSVWLPAFSAPRLAQCAKAWQERQVYEQCVEFREARVRSVQVHPGYDAEGKTNDVALLMLEEAGGAARAELAFHAEAPEGVTLAGYGENGIAGTATLATQNAVEVGWYNGKLAYENGRIGWLHQGPASGSATCSGDSGGPIYAQRYDGLAEKAPHRVHAVTSTGSSSTCQNFSVQQTSLAAPPVKAWLCAFPEVAGRTPGCAETIVAN
ncbi:trypsin-like serine protease [Massilia sp. Root418]|uniref:trypsin-like serine protease n=1 Tax=Massilia sp. Root418 TaxID=1736532 RepID=UPI000B32FB8E|nr:trypsin-like serine protease [Massilia sp. Root418]